MPQIQGNFPVHGDIHPFVNAGVGILHMSLGGFGSSVSGTQPVFGVGMGVRRRVSDGHGLVRAEIRYDHLSKWEKHLDPFTTVSFLASNQVSLKLGFDLLVGH